MVCVTTASFGCDHKEEHDNEPWRQCGTRRVPLFLSGLGKHGNRGCPSWQSAATLCLLALRINFHRTNCFLKFTWGSDCQLPATDILSRASIRRRVALVGHRLLLLRFRKSTFIACGVHRVLTSIYSLWSHLVSIKKMNQEVWSRRSPIYKCDQ